MRYLVVFLIVVSPIFGKPDRAPEKPKEPNYIEGIWVANQGGYLVWIERKNGKLYSEWRTRAGALEYAGQFEVVVGKHGPEWLETYVDGTGGNGLHSSSPWSWHADEGGERLADKGWWYLRRPKATD